MKLRDFVEHVANRVGVVYMITQEMAPIWHIVTSDGEEVIMPSITDNKDMAAFIARACMRGVDAQRYIFIDEGWMAFVKDESEIPVSGGVKDIAGRKEVVMFMAEDINEGTIMAYREIIRSNGRPYLGPLVVQDDGVNEGRFCGLLPVKKLHS